MICEDALKTKFPEFDLCVANIPYAISSPLVVKLLYGGFEFRGATLLLQKEFARRLLAKPGDSDYNRLAVNVNLVATVKHVMDVSKRDFVPCPKVDSLVVRIEPKRELLDVDLEEWRPFVRACFSKKNKTLGAIFKQKSRVRELLKMATGEPTGRHEEEDYDDGDAEDANAVEEDEGDDAAEMRVLKDKLVATLREGGFEGKRSSKLSIGELLRLLALFNKAGIYFHHQL